MPTDPPPANQSNPAAPLGQPQPPAQPLQQQLPAYPYTQHAQAQHQAHHIPLQLNPQANPTAHSQYGMSTGNVTPMQSLSQQQQQQTPAPPHQAQRAPLNPQQPYYPVNGFQQHMNAYSNQVAHQQFPMGAYVFQGHPSYAYGPMHGTGTAQQQPQLNPRTQRQFTPPVASNPTQRQPPRIPVSTPPKKILQIVDPDTNQEVKVSKVDARSSSAPPQPPASRPSPVKIPPRTSHALELVADPADDAHDASVAPKKPAEPQSVPSAGATKKDASSETSEPKRNVPPSAEAKGGAVALSEERTEPSAVHAISSMGNGAKEKAAMSTSHPEVSTPQAPQQLVAPLPPKETNVPLGDAQVVSTKPSKMDSVTTLEATASDISSGTAADSSTDAADSSLPESSITAVSTSDGAAERLTLDAPSSREAARETLDDASPQAAGNTPVSTAPEPKDITLEDVASLAPTADGNLLGKSDAPESRSAGDVESNKTGIVTEHLHESAAQGNVKPSEDKPALSSAVDDLEESTEAENIHILSPERPVFGDGDRRVYVPAFMWSMKAVPNAKKASEFEPSLMKSDILKNGSTRRSDSRGNRPMRGQAGPLSTDPRRAFPGQGGPGFQMVPMRGAAPPGMPGPGVGAYDAFDLRSARSQAPPPAPKGQPGREGDPRGTRQQGPRGRYDGPMRHGQGPIDPFIMHPPVEKLKKTDKGWKRNKEADDEITAKVKTVRSLLNKLTLEKFDKIFLQIVEVGISSFEILDGVVKEIFEKTLFEPKFSGMYAELCRRLDVALRDVLAKSNVLDPQGQSVTFRKVLLNNCREEFTRFAQSNDENEREKSSQDTGAAAEKNEAEEEEKLTPEKEEAKALLRKEEEELRATRAKRRMLANVRFIGELFLKDLLREQVIHKQCILKLLALGIEKKEEDVLEALCKLLSKTGAKLSENKDAVSHIDRYFAPLQALSRDHTLPARIRFMLQDLIEQRANNWKVRREEAGAKTIAEIHKEVEKEERAKQEAQAAARERRNRGGGGMHGRDRGPQNYTPRVAMTMASRQRPASNVSRSTAMLEKHANRSTSGMSTNLQSVRLGPGGSRMGGAGGGGSSSLRPGSGSSLFGSFSALTDNREPNADAQSGDVRRVGKLNKGWGSARRGPAKPEPVEPKVQLMPADKLKRKTRGIVEEFWSINMLSEARECAEQEIMAPNYPMFIEEAIRLSLDAKVDQREKSIPLFKGLIGEPVPAKDFAHAFSVITAQLGDLEMDNPRASEFLGKYIGATASTKKLEQGGSAGFGLGFVKSSLAEHADPKQIAKLVTFVFAELYKGLREAVTDEKSRSAAVRNAYKFLDIDLAALMNSWNPMRGLSALEDLLKANEVSFLVPLLKAEVGLKELLTDKPAGDKVFELLKSSGSSLTEEVMRLIVRQSFAWLCTSSPDDIKESFSAVVASPLIQCFGSEVPREIQMAALLECQSFTAMNMDMLPPVKTGNFDKLGSVLFEVLYESELVTEETFMRWKEDTGRSLKVPGKDKMLIQTSHFFQWLAQPEQ